MEWIKCEDKMPKPGVPVLVFVQHFGGGKYTRTIRAMYAAPKTLEAFDEDGGAVYDEEKDAYFCAEGWYECNEYEETHWSVSDTVTHWMPLPEPPVV